MAGFNGCPVNVAWHIALETCDRYLREHEGYPMDITLCTLDEKARSLGEQILQQIRAEYPQTEASS